MGSIPDGVIGFFITYSFWPYCGSGAPGISPGSYGSCSVGLKILPPSCADFLEILGAQPLGTLWACQGLYGIPLALALPLPLLALRYMKLISYSSYFAEILTIFNTL